MRWHRPRMRGGGCSASPSTAASRSLPSPHRSPITMPTGVTAFRRTWCRDYATTLARTPTSGSIGRARSTRAGPRMGRKCRSARALLGRVGWWQEGPMAQVLAEVRLAGSPLQSYRHVCAFFRSPDEFYTVLLPFIKEGFDRHERALHIVDPKLREEHIRRLEAVGIDTTAAEVSQQLELRVWEEAYLRGGHFVPDAMLTLLDERLSAGLTEGFPLTRLVATVEWALQDRPGVDDLVEYEARVNYLAASHADPLVCCYDLTQFSAGLVMDILRTHPMAIIGGTLHENPFFVPPDQLLVEPRGREPAGLN